MSRAPLRGEVTATVAGQDYVLVYTVDAIIALETAVDLDIEQIADKLKNKPRLGLLRAALHAALREHHRDVTLIEAGEWFRLPDSEALGRKIGEAFGAAFSDGEAGGATARPQIAAPAR